MINNLTRIALPKSISDKESFLVFNEPNLTPVPDLGCPLTLQSMGKAAVVYFPAAAMQMLVIN